MSYLDHEPTTHSVGLSFGSIYFWSSLHYPTISIADSNHNNYNIVNNDAHNQNNANGNTGNLITGIAPYMVTRSIVAPYMVQ